MAWAAIDRLEDFGFDPLSKEDLEALQEMLPFHFPNLAPRERTGERTINAMTQVGASAVDVLELILI